MSKYILQVLLIIALSCVRTEVAAQVELFDEGTDKGKFVKLDCVGAGISCTRSANTGTISVVLGAGGASNSFVTIATPAGTSPVADSTADTLTLTQGSPLVVTGTAGTDTIDFSCPTCGVTGSPLSQFAATTSAQLAGVISNETGSGLAVFGTTPTFTTSIIAPLVIGGTSTTSDLFLQTTSGVGVAGADMHFSVGNNGATEAMTILNSGLVGIGTTAPGDNVVIKGTKAKATISDNIIVHTLLFSTYDSQSNIGLEINGNTTVGGAHLVLSQTDTTSGDALGQIDFIAAGTAGSDKRGALIASTSQGSTATSVSGDLEFYTTNAGIIAQQVTIDKTGKVGIGTTTPSRLLSIAAAADSYISFNNGATEKWVVGRDTTNSGSFIIYDSAAGLYRMVIAESNGFVGIGTTTPNDGIEMGTGLNIRIPNIKSASGVRYVCVDTNGTLTSQAAACVGT